MNVLRDIGTLGGWLFKAAGVLIVLCAALGAGWVMLVATVFRVGYSTPFDWATV